MEVREVIREWKRDRSRNVLTLSVAVSNLMSANKSLRRKGKFAVQAELLLGFVLQTPLACYYLAGGGQKTA